MGGITGTIMADVATGSTTKLLVVVVAVVDVKLFWRILVTGASVDETVAGAGEAVEILVLLFVLVIVVKVVLTALIVSFPCWGRA
jgi:hypothetical protein